MPYKNSPKQPLSQLLTPKSQEYESANDQIIDNLSEDEPMETETEEEVQDSKRFKMENRIEGENMHEVHKWLQELLPPISQS